MTMTDNAAPAVLAGYASQQEDKPLLGHLFWYSVHKGTIGHADLKAKLDAVGLKAYTPNNPSPISQFKRVAKSSDKTIDLDNGNTAKIMVRDVGKGSDNMLRKVVVETTDTAGKRLSYEEVYNLEYHRDTEQLVVSPLVFGQTVADQIIPGIRSDFADGVARKLVPESAVRSAIKNAAEDHNAVCVRSTGGIYFVPRVNGDTLEAIAQFASGIEFVNMHLVPLPDEPGQPEMVANALAEASMAKAAEFSTDLAEMLKAGGEVSEARLASIIKGYKALRARLAEYQDLLGQDLSVVGTRLDVLDQQVQATALKMRVTGG